MNKETFITENAYGEDKSSLNYWKNHRNKLDDLYPSERYFLYPILKSTKSVLDVGCAAGGYFDFYMEAMFWVRWIQSRIIWILCKTNRLSQYTL